MAIKLLHIIGQLGVGGCEKQLLEMCRRMDKTKYELSVCYYTADKNALDKEFRAAGVSVYFIDKPALGPMRFFKKLCQIIKQIKPDIIHTWMYSPNFWGRLACFMTGQKKIIASSRSMKMPLDSMSKLMERLTRRRTQWVVNSKAIADITSKRFDIPPERMKVVYNAVELPSQDRVVNKPQVCAELGLQPGQPMVLSVGRLAKVKNYPMLFGVAQKMLAIDERVRFVIAGCGEEEAHLHDMCREMGLTNIIMLGLRHDVPRLMSAADAFVMCSHYEGFPNAVAEAMYSGLPVLCTKFEGADEVILDGKTGYLVDIDDVQTMTQKLLLLLQCPESAIPLAAAGQSWVRTHLSWNRLIKEMETVYTARLCRLP